MNPLSSVSILLVVCTAIVIICAIIYFRSKTHPIVKQISTYIGGAFAGIIIFLIACIFMLIKNNN